MMAMICLLLVGLAVAMAADFSLPPMVFLPGFGASILYGVIDNATNLPAACLPLDLPVGQSFLLDVSIVKSQDCLNYLLKLDYDPESGAYSSPPGITVHTDSFGTFQGIGDNYWDFPKKLSNWGYEVGSNLFGVPYDYRLMSDSSLTTVGFISSLKNLIETAYAKSNNQRVILVGHSNGGPTMYTFLTSSQLSQAWKDKHLAAMVGLSGNYLGQMNVIGWFTRRGSDENGFSDTQCSWEATYGSVSWGGYAEVQNVPFVTTFAGTNKEQKYTPKLVDLESLFQSIEREDWVERLQGMYGIHLNSTDKGAMDRSAHPLVDSYCLYGSDLKTEYGYVFANNVLDVPTTILSMLGDSDQDVIDNTFCDVWTSDSRSEASSFHVETEAFPGVDHMSMIVDDGVLDRLHEIVNKYRLP